MCVMENPALRWGISLLAEWVKTPDLLRQIPLLRVARFAEFRSFSSGIYLTPRPLK
jgi:hypothetical protein